MAELDEKTARVKELLERAEGFLSDAEFREDQDARVVRYFQALNSTLLALSVQNQIVIDLLTKQQALDRLSGD